ncbi:MAG: hypothetical protein CVV27_14175 [Candidatus Melainabacteria bacterium HGW-Melainabacteria-1]|nr:MAG: hypothetical protein CVV27_14175 [Candidatus Melainabacteria bacterium HGW-Melainabacteria-1]
MFDYDYLESLTSRAGDNPVYHMAPDLVLWVSVELEKRRASLAIEKAQDVTVYLTMRTFRKYPVFVIGLPQEQGVLVLEAWYFHMAPPSELKQGIQLVLDRVVLKQLFPKQSTAVQPKQTESEST